MSNNVEEKKVTATEAVEGSVEEKKDNLDGVAEVHLNKLDVAKVFIKNNWKRFAIGTAVVVDAGLAANHLKHRNNETAVEDTDYIDDQEQEDLEDFDNTIDLDN